MTDQLFCPYPWTHVQIWKDLSVGLCPCPSWLPVSAGTLDERTSLNEVFNSSVARKVRHSILDGSFRFCDHERCHFLQLGNLPKKKEILQSGSLIWNHTQTADRKFRQIIRQKKVAGFTPNFHNLSFDDSCNLSCPSCRKDFHKLDPSSPEFRKKHLVQQKLLQHFREIPADSWGILSVSGVGDPFASEIYMNMLEQLDGSSLPQVKINLQTNGLLFTPHNWERLRHVHANINDIIVSCDAASAATYAKVRRGGSWQQLMKNLGFIAELKKTKLFNGQFRLDFVVQQKNYKEMIPFVKIANELEVDTIVFHAIQHSFFEIEYDNWETYTQEAVWRPEHSEYALFRKILEHPLLDDPRINFELMSPDRENHSHLISHRHPRTLRDWKHDLVDTVRHYTKKIFYN